MVRTGWRDREGVGILYPTLVGTSVKDKYKDRGFIFNAGRDKCKRQGGVGVLSAPLVRTGVRDKEGGLIFTAGQDWCEITALYLLLCIGLWILGITSFHKEIIRYIWKELKTFFHNLKNECLKQSNLRNFNCYTKESFFLLSMTQVLQNLC